MPPISAQTFARWMLSLQTCSEVRDHGDGRADLLGDVVDKNFLAVGSDVIEDLRSGCGDGDLLRRPELRGSIDFLDREYKEIETGSI
jgi:hypothetical protein